VVVAVAVTAFVQAGMVMFMATAPLNLKLHGHEDAVYGVISGHFLGMLSLSFFAGRLTDRLGRRTLILAGAMVFIAGALSTPLFQNPLYVGASLFMVGLGWCLCYVAGNAVLADMTGPLERGRTMGANDLVVGLINSAAAFLAGLFYGGTGYLTVGIVSSLLVLAPLALALRLREPEPGVYATDKPA
jgi:MFS family permease